MGFRYSLSLLLRCVAVLCCPVVHQPCPEIAVGPFRESILPKGPREVPPFFCARVGFLLVAFRSDRFH